MHVLQIHFRIDEFSLHIHVSSSKYSFILQKEYYK